MSGAQGPRRGPASYSPGGPASAALPSLVTPRSPGSRGNLQRGYDTNEGIIATGFPREFWLSPKTVLSESTPVATINRFCIGHGFYLWELGGTTPHEQRWALFRLLEKHRWPEGHAAFMRSIQAPRAPRPPVNVASMSATRRAQLADSPHSPRDEAGIMTPPGMTPRGHTPSCCRTSSTCRAARSAPCTSARRRRSSSPQARRVGQGAGDAGERRGGGARARRAVRGGAQADHQPRGRARRRDQPAAEDAARAAPRRRREQAGRRRRAARGGAPSAR